MTYAYAIDPEIILYGEEYPEPAYTCPNCRTEWYKEGISYESADGVGYHAYPKAGDFCPCCAIHEATAEQLHKAVKLAGVERLVVGHILNCKVSTGDTTSDAMDALMQYMPDAFTDACRDVLEDGLLDYLLEVLKDEA